MKNLWNKFLSFFKKDDDVSCKGPKKVSLHIGINDYPGRRNDLRGCVNDAHSWMRLLKNHFGFSTKVVLDNKATKRTIIREMNNIVRKSCAGDYIVITFSGHGTHVRDNNGDETDGRDEALCLYDALLLDDDLRKIFNLIHKEATLVFISDCCHSGTITRSFLDGINGEEEAKVRFLPPADEEEAFDLASRSQNKKFLSEEDMTEILLSGCDNKQYSFDAKISGKFQGAMTANAVRIIEQNKDLTWEEFHALLRSRLPSRRYKQSPQLEGPKDFKKKKMFK